jgi:hypothetical protein
MPQSPGTPRPPRVGLRPDGTAIVAYSGARPDPGLTVDVVSVTRSGEIVEHEPIADILIDSLVLDRDRVLVAHWGNRDDLGIDLPPSVSVAPAGSVRFGRSQSVARGTPPVALGRAAGRMLAVWADQTDGVVGCALADDGSCTERIGPLAPPGPHGQLHVTDTRGGVIVLAEGGQLGAPGELLILPIDGRKPIKEELEPRGLSDGDLGITTLGADLAVLQVKREHLRLSLWDAAGRRSQRDLEGPPGSDDPAAVLTGSASTLAVVSRRGPELHVERFGRGLQPLGEKVRIPLPTPKASSYVIAAAAADDEVVIAHGAFPDGIFVDRIRCR